jgi:hypothetical protein
MFSSCREAILKMRLRSCSMIVIAAVVLTVCHPGYCFPQLSNSYRKSLSTTSSGASIEG